MNSQVSSYMELDPSLGGQMQKQVTCNQELLNVCLPMLEACDAQFSDWYRSKKGPDSIHKLVRLQSFITRYRVNPDESAGLLRHIDGVQVCSSFASMHAPPSLPAYCPCDYFWLLCLFVLCWCSRRRRWTVPLSSLFQRTLSGEAAVVG